jgi:tetratricopeptide (TPR) repeat protein
MITRTIEKIAVGVLVILFPAALAAGQAGRGTARIGGVVVDAVGNPISSAKVVAVYQEDSNVKIETVANDKGEWAILGVGTGGWLITASAEGYLPNSVNFVSKQLSKNPKITIQLEKRGAAAGGIVEDESSFELLEQGNEFYKDGKYETALMMYQQFLEKNPTAYQVGLNIGDCYREKGELDKAIESYNKVIAQAKNDSVMGKTVEAKSLAGIGVCYLKQNNLEEAEKVFKQSIDTDPQDETLAYNVGEICFSNQQIDEAERYFELAAKIKPDWPDPYLKLGYVYLNKGDMARAVEYLERFIKLEGDTPRSAQAQNIINTIKK